MENKHYFYVGVYEISSEDGTVIGSRFSGVVKVDIHTDPGPLYTTILQEWWDLLIKQFEIEEDSGASIKIYLEKLERIE